VLPGKADGYCYTFSQSRAGRLAARAAARSDLGKCVHGYLSGASRTAVIIVQ